VRTFGIPLAFVPLVQVRVGFPRRLTQVRLTDDVVPVKYRSGLVAAGRHRHSLRHPGADQIPDSGSAEIMKEPSRLSGFLISGPQTLHQSTRAPSFCGSYCWNLRLGIDLDVIEIGAPPASDGVELILVGIGVLVDADLLVFESDGIDGLACRSPSG
jgi:hypothetical protein